MEKAEHGARLKVAMASKGLGRRVIADATGQRVRTVTNWRSGGTMPSEANRIVLRRLLGSYDEEGDGVETAVRQSVLVDWRQDTVIGFYKKHLYEQAESLGA